MIRGPYRSPTSMSTHIPSILGTGALEIWDTSIFLLIFTLNLNIKFVERNPSILFSWISQKESLTSLEGRFLLDELNPKFQITSLLTWILPLRSVFLSCRVPFQVKSNKSPSFIGPIDLTSSIRLPFLDTTTILYSKLSLFPHSDTSLVTSCQFLHPEWYFCYPSVTSWN